MKALKTQLVPMIVMALMSSAGMAGTVAGTGGSTEITQIANNIQLAKQYEQQIAAYVRQGIQMENEMKNLIQNPASILGTDIGRIINGVGDIMSGGNAIGANMARIDKNFASTFKSPQAASLSKNFLRWHKTNTDTLEGAMKSAGLHRDQYASETEALSALYNQSQQTNGSLDSLQTLSQINVRQIQQMQSLGDLVASQNIAASTYMATQNAKEEASRAAYDQIATPYTAPIPPVQTAPAVKWNNVLFKK
jgi:type IV secretion system protein TrbJ